jgi:ABC-type Fe3+-hydroxamate transport system substrate-binding protein
MTATHASSLTRRLASVRSRPARTLSRARISRGRPVTWLRPTAGGRLRRVVVLVALALAWPTPAAAVRIASLVPLAEDALLRVDAGSELVAAVRRDLRAAPPGTVLDLGNPHDPSLEKLAEAAPDLVVGDLALHGRLRAALGGAARDVLLIDGRSVAGTFAGLRALGERAGVGAAMSAEVARAERALASLALAAPVPVLPLFSAPGSFLVVTGDVWLGDLLARLGFENLGAGVAGRARHPGYVAVSDEALAALRPELVLLVAHGNPDQVRRAFVARIEGDGLWSGLRTSARRGVHVLPPDLFATNPGLAMPEAAERLRSLAAEP